MLATLDWFILLSNYKVTMIGKAPRNHTSIYLSDYLKNNWKDIKKFIPAKGFTSLNSYIINLMTEDFNNNYAKLMNQKHVEPEKRIDVYNDTKTIIKEKMNHWSDGEQLDFYNTLTDIRNTLIHDMKRRGTL
jgi:hypothetical protein